jgi:predicted nucleic acid-binding protein
VALVLDTGVLYAALDENDRDHAACAELLSSTEEALIVPEPVLVELDYWLRKNATIDVWLAFVDDVQSGAYSLWPVDASLVFAAAQVQARFADQRLGFVDAAVFSTCEALGEPKVATLDHRHFGVLRTADGHALRLLPE